MRVVIVDTAYPEFLKTLATPHLSYERELELYMHRCFGTFDAYSRALTALGHQCIDIVANHIELQKLWWRENNIGVCEPYGILEAQIESFKPDCVFMQDLSFVPAKTLKRWSEKYLLAGQCSCPLPAEEQIRPFACLFSSFPHYIPKFEALGVKAVYLPLAFDPIVNERCVGPTEKIFDVVFVGGMGRHWNKGTEVLEAVAREIPTSLFFGYGYDSLPKSSAIRDKYRGPAFGIHQYKIYRQAKIVVSRHGEVAEGYTNNLRTFEASGSGALLATEHSTNLGDFFSIDECVGYVDAADAVRRIKTLLTAPEWLSEMATRGRKRTLRDHTYANRMPIVSDVLQWMLN